MFLATVTQYLANEMSDLIGLVYSAQHHDWISVVATIAVKALLEIAE